MTAPPASRRHRVRSATEIFDGALRRLLESLADVLSQPELSARDAEAYLASLADAVRDRIERRDASPVDPALGAHPLFDPMLAGIFHELMRPDPDAESAYATVQVLHAMASLRADVGATRPVIGQLEDLRSRLSAPDAFELLIEVAHDFRSPLTSILFLAETLRDGNSGDVNELQRTQLGLVYSAAFGLASVASDVMDLARREENLIGVDTEPYALAEVFDNVQRLVNPIVEEKGLELRIVAPALTQAHGHPHALSRVLLNLTTNALKFTDEGFVEVGVVPLHRARLQFYVQDTGRGIPAERRADLFQPFKKRLGQAHGGHFFSGSGIGLSIARRLVVAMGSELELESSDERGTRFSFVVSSAPPREV